MNDNKNAFKTALTAAGVALLAASVFTGFMWLWFEKGGPL